MVYHVSGHPSAAGRGQDRESSPAKDRRSTAVLLSGIRNIASDMCMFQQDNLSAHCVWETVLLQPVKCWYSLDLISGCQTARTLILWTTSCWMSYGIACARRISSIWLMLALVYNNALLTRLLTPANDMFVNASKLLNFTLNASLTALVFWRLH